MFLLLLVLTISKGSDSCPRYHMKSRQHSSSVSLQERRGEQVEQSYIDNKRLMFKAVLPLNEIVVDFFDELKSLTSGYAR